MRIDSIRQWQWILFSLAVGLAIGYLREQAGVDLAAEYGSEINSQARFEQALVSQEQGQARFTQIRVLKRPLPDRNGVEKEVSLVYGQYFNGHFEAKDGKLIGYPEPAFYIASIPYKPATDILRRGDGKAAAQFTAVANPTVADFLDALSTGGVRYSRAWWQGLRMWQWVVLCVVVIGFVWPVTINLLVFGSWRRPREEKGIDLSKVKLPPPQSQKAELSEEEIAQLAAMTDGLEQELLVDAAVPAALQDAAAVEVRELATSAVTPVAQPENEDITYGAKPDDFYPTAKVSPHEHKK